MLREARVCVLDLWESFDTEADYSSHLVGYQLTKVVNVTGVDHKVSMKSINLEKLSNMWQIGLDSAKLTFHSITQTHIRDITSRSEK